eukprot:TRINITY_DN5432_c0_g1_i2.p1 TRINITY_DN5432_c0_g1~~TRINITY_DN5432_c0_g1_i2.p1  ORF type:complete len:974 (+),score=255.66 TRINITY_DN5432_c0_g1_i2:43-2964(+)
MAAAASEASDGQPPAVEEDLSIMSPNGKWKRLEKLKTKDSSSEKAYMCIDVARGVSVVWNEVDVIKDTQNVDANMTKIMKLKHPNLVQVFDYWTKGNKVIYITESISASSLKSYIKPKEKEERKISLKIIGRWVTQIVSALWLLHTRKRPLRRLRPENIYVQHTGQIKISPVNFIQASNNTATSKAARSSQAGILKLPQSRLVEIAYCYSTDAFSRNEKEPSMADDLYALGILVLELVMQERAFSELFSDPRQLIKAKESQAAAKEGSEAAGESDVDETKDGSEKRLPLALKKMKTDPRDLSQQYDFVRKCLTKQATIHDLVFHPWLFKVPSLQAFAAKAALRRHKDDPDAVCAAIESRLESRSKTKSVDKDGEPRASKQAKLECSHTRQCQCSVIHHQAYNQGAYSATGFKPCAAPDTTIEILLEQSRHGLHPLAVVRGYGPGKRKESSPPKATPRKYTRRLCANEHIALEIQRTSLGNAGSAQAAAAQADPASTVATASPPFLVPDQDPLRYRHHFTIYFCLGKEKSRKPKRDQITPDNSVPPTPAVAGEGNGTVAATTATQQSFAFQDAAAKSKAGGARPSLSGASGRKQSGAGVAPRTAPAAKDEDAPAGATTTLPTRATRQPSDSNIDPSGEKAAGATTEGGKVSGNGNGKRADKSDGEDKLDKRHVWRKLTIEMTGSDLLDTTKVLKRKTKAARASSAKDVAAPKRLPSLSVKTTTAHKMAETLAALMVEYELLHRDDGDAMIRGLASYIRKLYPDPLPPSDGATPPTPAPPNTSSQAANVSNAGSAASLGVANTNAAAAAATTGPAEAPSLASIHETAPERTLSKSAHVTEESPPGETANPGAQVAVRVSSAPSVPRADGEDAEPVLSKDADIAVVKETDDVTSSPQRSAVPVDRYSQVRSEQSSSVFSRHSSMQSNVGDRRASTTSPPTGLISPPSGVVSPPPRANSNTSPRKLGLGAGARESSI